MTNDFDVIDNDYVQVPKIIISILQDQVAVINNLSKQYTNSKDIIYTAKGVALSKINNWVAPFGIYKETCHSKINTQDAGPANGTGDVKTLIDDSQTRDHSVGGLIITVNYYLPDNMDKEQTIVTYNEATRQNNLYIINYVFNSISILCSTLVLTTRFKLKKISFSNRISLRLIMYVSMAEILYSISH
ncbi:16439_t:CDS:2, partial [Funneliformis mosseae]